MNFVFIIIYILMMCGLVVAIGFMLNRMMTKHQMNPEVFLGLLTILSSQIKSELDSYDQDIFVKKGAITNNNFDNYYRDLTSRIIKNISPELINGLSFYYTEEAIYRYIGRSVRDYLVTKINGSI